MGRRVFYSFHYDKDSWRASQIRNIGKLDGNNPIKDNNWEEIKKGGDKAIKNWINKQLKKRSCTIVLIGEKTDGRKWIKYEIKKTWELGKGILGIKIHNLKDKDGKQSFEGKNPFDDFTYNDTNFSNIVKCYNPPFSTSKYTYNYIKENIEDWVEKAIKTRKKYK